MKLSYEMRKNSELKQNILQARYDLEAKQQQELKARQKLESKIKDRCQSWDFFDMIIDKAFENISLNEGQ